MAMATRTFIRIGLISLHSIHLFLFIHWMKFKLCALSLTFFSCSFFSVLTVSFKLWFWTCFFIKWKQCPFLLVQCHCPFLFCMISFSAPVLVALSLSLSLPLFFLLLPLLVFKFKHPVLLQFQALIACQDAVHCYWLSAGCFPGIITLPTYWKYCVHGVLPGRAGFWLLGGLFKLLQPFQHNFDFTVVNYVGAVDLKQVLSGSWR